MSELQNRIKILEEKAHMDEKSLDDARQRFNVKNMIDTLDLLDEDLLGFMHELFDNHYFKKKHPDEKLPSLIFKAYGDADKSVHWSTIWYRWSRRQPRSRELILNAKSEKEKFRLMYICGNPNFKFEDAERLEHEEWKNNRAMLLKYFNAPLLTNNITVQRLLIGWTMETYGVDKDYALFRVQELKRVLELEFQEADPSTGECFRDIEK